MAKKKFSLADYPVPTLQAKAISFLEEGCYREAVDIYKYLLKQEVRQEWQDSLTTAYLKWAETLANKKMYKEAVALWENCPQTQQVEHYLLWLLGAGRFIKAIEAFIKFHSRLSNNDPLTQSLLALMGILLLTDATLVERLPQDFPLRKHYPLIKAALQAYGQGDEAESYLKQIPFRSPYRDFSQLLKALIHPSQAKELLEKVPSHSPYKKLAKLVQAPPTKLNSLTEAEQKLVACLKGFNPQELNLLRTAVSQNPHVLFDKISSEPSILGAERSRQFCLALLPSCPELILRYEKIFEPLPEFTKRRCQALYYERQENFIAAEKQWRIAVDLLKRQAEETDAKLKAALILRHLVELAKLRSSDTDANEIIGLLVESLQLDPHDKDTYLKLIELSKGQKTYHQWTEIAIKQFPQDSDLLALAMEAASAKKAFKKAAAFANRLLKVDPIHSRAKQILLSAHLSHARKLIKSSKYSLARQELGRILPLEKNSKPSGRRIILEVLLAWQEEQASTMQLLQEGHRLAGGGLLGQFCVSLEMQRLGIKQPLLAPLAAKYLPTPQEILGLLNLINAAQGEDLRATKKVVSQLKAPLQLAVTQSFSKAEMVSICQCFKQIKHYDLLTLYANQALKNWPAQPIFVFYQTLGKIKNMLFNLEKADLDNLEDAFERANQQGDKRTVMMIVSFMNEVTTTMGAP